MTNENLVFDELISLINDNVSQPVTANAVKDLEFSDLGLDSETAVIITGDLSDRLDLDIDPLIIYETPNITDFVKCVSKMMADEALACAN